MLVELIDESCLKPICSNQWERYMDICKHIFHKISRIAWNWALSKRAAERMANHIYLCNRMAATNYLWKRTAACGMLELWMSWISRLLHFLLEMGFRPTCYGLVIALDWKSASCALIIVRLRIGASCPSCDWIHFISTEGLISFNIRP